MISSSGKLLEMQVERSLEKLIETQREYHQARLLNYVEKKMADEIAIKLTDYLSDPFGECLTCPKEHRIICHGNKPKAIDVDETWEVLTEYESVDCYSCN